MTERQKLEVRQSEVRQRLNELLALDTLTPEQTQEMETLTAEAQQLEVRFRAAVAAEAAEAAEADAAAGEPDGEARERQALETRARMTRYLGAYAAGRAPEGAEAELQAAVNLGAESIPWSVLAPPPPSPETRAVTPGPTNLPGRSTFIERVFADGDALFLGVMMPTVPAGEAIYNLVTAGPFAGPKPKDSAADATAGSFGGAALKPTRIPARYTLRVEELVEDMALEEAIRRDLRGLLSEALDKRVIAGAGSVGSFDPGISQLSDPADDSATLTTTSMRQMIAGGVDGKYAHTLRDVRLLVGADTHTLISSFTDNAGAYDPLAWVMTETGGLRVSAHLPAPASNIQRGVLAKRGARVAAYAPVWEGVQILRDPYTDAEEGQVHLTAWMLAAFKAVDADNFVLRDLKLA